MPLSIKTGKRKNKNRSFCFCPVFISCPIYSFLWSRVQRMQFRSRTFQEHLWPWLKTPRTHKEWKSARRKRLQALWSQARRRNKANLRGAWWRVLLPEAWEPCSLPPLCLRGFCCNPNRYSRGQNMKCRRKVCPRQEEATPCCFLNVVCWDLRRRRRGNTPPRRTSVSRRGALPRRKAGRRFCLIL